MTTLLLHLAFANLPPVFPNPNPCGGVRVSNLTSSAVSRAAAFVFLRG
jgi:hypothetical protein